MAALSPTNQYCGLITDPLGPFAECIASFPKMALEFFASCKYDTCASEGNPEMVMKTRCMSLEAFAEECAEQGVPLKWRTPSLCRMYILIAMRGFFDTFYNEHAQYTNYALLYKIIFIDFCYALAYELFENDRKKNKMKLLLLLLVFR